MVNFIRQSKPISVFFLLVMVSMFRAVMAQDPMPEAATGPGALTVRGDRLFISARVNGVETVHALLDSGAEMSLIDAGFANEAGLGTSGSETAHGTGGTEEVTFAQGVTLEAAEIALKNQTVAVLDLQELASRLIGSPVDMIVGRELFDAGRWFIDIAEGRIEPAGGESDPPGVQLPMQTHYGLQTIPVSLEGHESVQAAFDLGNGSEVLIGADYAERLGLLAAERIVGQKAGGGIGGEVVRDLVVLRQLKIADTIFHDVAAAIDRTDRAADVNVGVRVLRNFRLTVDFPANAVWLEPISPP